MAVVVETDSDYFRWCAGGKQLYVIKVTVLVNRFYLAERLVFNKLNRLAF